MKDIEILEKVSKRIESLRNITIQKNQSYSGEYKDLQESEKIPIRVVIAEMEALREFMFGDDNLDKYIEICVKNEQYCGAEGIKNAKKWLVESNLAYPTSN